MSGPVTFATRADEDAYWMGQALAEAEQAAQEKDYDRATQHGVTQGTRLD